MNRYDLSGLDWTLTGFVPYEWQLGHSLELGSPPKPEVPPIPAPVPGSVQQALLRAGVIPDWNIGLNARPCEWVENRHWVYEALLPDEWLSSGNRFRLHSGGLDGPGEIYLNHKPIYRFANAFVPHTLDITDHLRPRHNVLQIVFECPPRWLGQFYWTSRIKEWKPRFNYTWDWTSRLVQMGIWDDLFLDLVADAEITDLHLASAYDIIKGCGALTLRCEVAGSAADRLAVTLRQDQQILQETAYPVAAIPRDGIAWNDLAVAPWWPNGSGNQPLYSVQVELLDPQGQVLDRVKRRIGFKHIDWCPCQDAPAAADPWLCAINGRPIFLQGINWTPIRPNFADVTREDYRRRLTLYRDLGMNTLRVWGGAFLEKTWFYDLCDELGLLVWQEFPLSSSGLENYPPDDPAVIEEFCVIAASYVSRRHHHVSLLLWSGGNELTTRGGEVTPMDESHPLMAKLAALVRQQDPCHRFVATSPSGPEFFAHQKNYGRGRHWDVHGPWKTDGLLTEAWRSYWLQDDALFRSEMGAPGPSNAQLIERYRGDCSAMPADMSNPLWRRTGWWIEWDVFRQEMGRDPVSLEDYVRWGQLRQADILTTAVQSCKNRFPRCGGVLIWMGHDSFPCTANTSIVDFEGNPKSAALALAEVFLCR